MMISSDIFIDLWFEVSVALLYFGPGEPINKLHYKWQVLLYLILEVLPEFGGLAMN